jgi:serine/threonine-protein phosphatase 6 regulatory ankyrin repeat subunit B
MDTFHFDNLLKATFDGNLERVKEIIEAGGDVNSINEFHWTALHIASDRGHLELVEYLLEKGASLEIRCDESIRYFALSIGSDLDDKAIWEKWNLRGRFLRGTPLNLAAFRGHIMIANLLIKNGANLNIKGGHKPLDLAIFNNQREMAEFLIKHKAPTSYPGKHIYYRAIKHNAPDVLELLIKKNVPKDEKSKLLNDLLLFTSRGGSIQILEKLLKLGANPNAKDAKGKTSLHHVVLRDQDDESLKILTLLIEKGADMAAKQKNGLTPLELAQKQKHKDFVRILKFAAKE